MCVPIEFDSEFVWSVSRKLEVLLEIGASLKRIMIKILLIKYIMNFLLNNMNYLLIIFILHKFS
jgi:hypothetical protein